MPPATTSRIAAAFVLAALAAVCATWLPGAAVAGQAPDTSLPGPYPVASDSFEAGESGIPTRCDLVRPDAAGVYPGIVLGHGFSQDQEYQRDNARQLASWGFVVLVPTFSSLADHAANGEEMLALLDWLTGAQNPYQDQVDAERLGLAGHSAGGLSATVAAGLDADSARRVSAVAGLDAVDLAFGGRSLGTPYAARIAAPALYLSGIPYGCNAAGNAQGLFDAVPAGTGKMFLRITEAVHCDFNTQGLDRACAPRAEPAPLRRVLWLLRNRGFDAAYIAFTAGVCAVDGMDRDRTAEILLVRRYLTAWFLAHLADRRWALAYLYDGAVLSSDLAAGVVEDLAY